MTLDPDAGWFQYIGFHVLRFGDNIIRRYKRLNWIGKTVVWFLVLFHVLLVFALVYIGADNLFQYMFDLSQVLRKSRHGWWILGLVMIVASLPPMVGFSTSVTICGFAWGLKGFYLAGPACYLGAAFSFLTLRFVFQTRLKRLSETNQRWRALEEVVEAKGLPLIILIRFSPVPPWVYSNALFASIQSVSFWQFMVATLFILPKTLLTVFVASRVAALADRDQRGDMDTPTKVLNIASIVLGITVGLGTGWLIYRLVQEKIRNASGLPRHVDETAANIIEDADQGAPLLRPFSPSGSDDEDEFAGYDATSNGQKKPSPRR